MSQLPRLSGRELVKVLGKVGFELKRQHGSLKTWGTTVKERL